MKNENLLWTILAVVVLFSFFGMFGIGRTNYGYNGMMGMMYGSYGSNMMFFGWTYGIVILVALILLIVWLLQQIQNPTRKKR